MQAPFLRFGLLGLFLVISGCSAQVLEDIAEVAPPRPCTETMKVFGTFSMRAKSIAWKSNKGAAPEELTLNLVFYNDKNFPIALSNSGNGVHYAVSFNLQGKDGPVAAKMANGIVLVRKEKTFQAQSKAGPFGEKHKRGSSSLETFTSTPVDKTRDVNFRIKPGEPEEGSLVFQLPRDNYLLLIERKFAEKPSARQPSDLIAVCKISDKDVSGQYPSGMSGVY